MPIINREYNLNSPRHPLMLEVFIDFFAEGEYLTFIAICAPSDIFNHYNNVSQLFADNKRLLKALAIDCLDYGDKDKYKNCSVSLHSSVVCEKGVKGCNTNHIKNEFSEICVELDTFSGDNRKIVAKLIN